MKAYSTDLRQKIIDAYKNGEGSLRDIAKRFSVSLSFVWSLWTRYKQTDSVEPKPHGGGRAATIDANSISVHVFLVDPDPAMGGALGALLATYGIEVRSFTEVPDYLAAIRSGNLDDSVLLLSVDFPGVEPALLLRDVCDDEHCIPTIALSNDRDKDLRCQVLASGAIDLVYRPLLAAYLFTRLHQHFPALASFLDTTPTISLADGTDITFRMMQPEDADIEQHFVTALSDRSRYLRFFVYLKELPPHLLTLLTHPDFPLSYAVIATIERDGLEEQIGVARYAPTEEEDSAEFAVVVADDWQRHGIGSLLMQLVVTAATIAGLRQLEGMILKKNKGMLVMAEKMGFHPAPRPEDEPSVVRVVKELREDQGV